MKLKELEKLIQSGVDNGAFPGATYAIVFKDKIYTNYVGNKALYPSIEENSVDTIYDMASCSKVISTASCILKLIETGKIRLFTKVSEIIPEFIHKDLTVWNLVTHTSGLIECVPNHANIKDSNEIWEKVMNADKPYPSNEHIKYSDLNFILLGEIIKRVSGKPLDEFVKSEIFDKLEMFDTGYNPKDIQRCAPTEERNDLVVQGIVRGKVHDETAYTLGGVAGHAGLFSTANDTAKFIQMILNDGMYKNTKVFPKCIIDMMYTPLVKEPVGLSVLPLQRSVGWIIKDYNPASGDLVSNNTIQHTGFTGTNIWIDRDNEVGFCLLSNRVHPTRNNLKHMELRPKVANYLIANLESIKEEIYNGN